MFEFGFSAVDDHSLNLISENECNLDWLPAKEVLLSERENSKILDKEIQTINLNYLTIKYLVHSEIDVLKDSEGNVLKEHSDLVPAKYEGGMKVWECTFDLAYYLTSPESSVDVKNKTVLDLGCGSGILGIVCLKLGAQLVHFQDYNESVLRTSTIPNLALNGYDEQSCKYFSGDWASFVTLNDQLYDVILTSETIYNDKNYQKLHKAFKLKLKQDGVVLLAAKTYYFGVGGGTRQFDSLVEKEDIFESAVKWKCSAGVHREILELRFKTL